MTTQAVPASRTKSRIYLIAIIALFFGPLLIAWLLVGRWQPGGSVHHGELLNPAQPIVSFSAQRLDGTQLTDKDLYGHWTLLFLNPQSNCAQDCRTQLYNMRQARLALGKNMQRAQTVLLTRVSPSIDFQQWLAQEHSAMSAATLEPQSAAAAFFLQAFPTRNEEAWIYLLDPLGNLLMRYPSDINPKGILEDLKRLFKYSKIG